MERKELDSLVVKKTEKKDVVLTVKVNGKSLEALRKRGIDVAKTVQNVIDRLAQG